jgi:hypothetical protein
VIRCDSEDIFGESRVWSRHYDDQEAWDDGVYVRLLNYAKIPEMWMAQEYGALSVRRWRHDT